MQYFILIFTIPMWQHLKTDLVSDDCSRICICTYEYTDILEARGHTYTEPHEDTHKTHTRR